MRSLPFYAAFFRKTLAKTAAICDDRFVRDAAGVGLRRKMIKEGNEVSVGCQFCDENYVFTIPELQELLP